MPRLLGPHIKEGMRVIDVGAGMGYFSIGMAKIVGAGGRVIAIDLQERMLDILRRRAARNGVLDRIQTVLCERDGFSVDFPADFGLAFWMVHETPDQKKFFDDCRRALKPGSLLLIAEPIGHVSNSAFSETVSVASEVGFTLVGRPPVAISRAALLRSGE